jgi:hypothetical protein
MQNYIDLSGTLSETDIEDGPTMATFVMLLFHCEHLGISEDKIKKNNNSYLVQKYSIMIDLFK